MTDPTHTGDSRERRIRDRRTGKQDFFGAFWKCSMNRFHLNGTACVTPRCAGMDDRRRPDSDRRRAPQVAAPKTRDRDDVPNMAARWGPRAAYVRAQQAKEEGRTAPTPVQPAGATNQDWMAAISRAMGADEEGSVWTPGEVEDILRDALKTARERSDLLDKSERVLAASSVPVPATEMVAVPLKLVNDLKEFLNRRMERDRWMNEQGKLRDGLDDCIDPLRERPMDFCAMCAGTGKRYDKNDSYIGPCGCVRPAREHPDSYVANRTAPAREGK